VDESPARPEPDRGAARQGAAGTGAANRRWRAIGTRALQIALTVLVTWAIFRAVGVSLDDLRGLDSSRWRPRPGWFVASCALLLTGYLVSAALWARMVREMGGAALGSAAGVRIYFIANLGRYIPGKLWQIAGLAALARREGVPASVATAAAVLGQGMALVGATLIGLGTLLQARGPWRAWGVAIVAVAVAGVVVASVPGAFRKITGLWFRLARTPEPEDIRPGPAFALGWVGLYTVNWAIYAASFWLLVKSFQLPATLFEAAPAFAAAYVIGYAFLPAPAGVGVREGALVAFLGPVVGVATATALALVARLWTTGVEVVPAAAFWIAHVTGGASSPGSGERP